MSPEQAAGRHDQVGPASDVFSLGATLYCLLTGRKPFEGTTVADEVARTRKGQFPPAREVKPDAPAALDAVCRRAMAFEPADRYPSALDLAADVERWLADEPVAVYRDPWPVRAGRWARRHRTGVAAAAVLLVTATVGLSLGTALLWKEERRTRDEYDRAEREHLLAQRGFETARSVALDMGKQIEAIEVGQVNPQQTDRRRRAALDSARKQFEALVADNPDDLVLKKQLAQLHRYSGNLSRLLGDFGVGEKAYIASVRLWEELAQMEPDDVSHVDNLALTLGDLASVQKRGGRLREAVTTLDRAAALAGEVKDRVPADWHQRTMGLVWLGRSDVQYRLGLFADAERSAAAAVPLYQALASAPPGERRQTDPIFAAGARRARGAALRELGKVPDALGQLDDAVHRLTDLGGAKGGRDVRHNFNKSRLERVVTRPAADAAEALGELDLVIADADKLAAEYPTAAFYKEVLADALVRRADRTARSAPTQAAADYGRADKLTRELVDNYGTQPDHVTLRGHMFLGRGRLLAQQGQAAEAAVELDKAVRTFKVATDLDPDNVGPRRGLEEAREAAQAYPVSAKP
jgi:tetratricopeptide (TPR) repeat protein